MREVMEAIPGRFRTRTKAKAKRGNHPPNSWGPYANHEDGPTRHEQRCTAWGFLLAAAWFKNELIDPPTKEYLEVFADLHGLAVPGFSECVLEMHEGGGEE